jgi:hypothetical protein
MALACPPATIVEVRDPDRIKRYTLVPRSSLGGGADRVKRFTLARVGASPRSALGADRLERMEEIAAAERERESHNGGDPTRDPSGDGAGDQESRS